MAENTVNPPPVALTGLLCKSALKLSPSASKSLFKTEVAPFVVVVAVPPSTRVILSVLVTGALLLELKEPT